MDNHEGPYRTTVKRDVKHSKSGKFPTFQIRIALELKAQFKVAATEAWMGLGNWLKMPGRRGLEQWGLNLEVGCISSWLM
ncbi:toxin-antitoxin system HicB family antitoxin [Pantoea endophytica]|uniref:Toxin-antitoxin system HicB family antitoxin n=1 Tax=Pantoea endophytica TaxID=92488 RepID=A0ABX4SSX9_9GAMM|nr:toxin-antitoxin system HicB family antitoxin [Pantoea endophytica]PLR25322.1 toxin-antitoxin system HicB family antitoxin [Pantoea endophytica]